MYARVTQFHVLPDKVEQFIASVREAIPHARRQQGFRGLLVLQESSSAPSVEIRVISVWNSNQDLLAGEQNFYFYQALAKVMITSKGFPAIEGQPVLFADFGVAHSIGAPSDETTL